MPSAQHPAIAATTRNERVLTHGRDIIFAEADALRTLGQAIGAPFASAVALLQPIGGRVCVCGLGKSGQIARKIAATLAATGTPAIFLHAGEAVHGDLGMLGSQDALLILSNSGETRELGAIARYAAMHDIPIVAITSSPRSQLGQAAAICLVLPEVPEICPHGSSPTTSTIMMLALGDAIAITLMNIKGTTAATLLTLHPGGRLGFDLTPIESFMHRGDALPLVTPADAMEAVIQVMSNKGFGIAAVVGSTGKLEGVITDGDIRRHAASLSRARACDVMTANPYALTETMLARKALEILSHARITSLLVTDQEPGGRVVGLVHVHDLLRLGVG